MTTHLELRDPEGGRPVTEIQGWTKWADQRPTDHKAAYRWRVSPRRILGLMMQPEWTSKLCCVGMGYGPNEWWPEGSNWDGYSRTIDKTIEWRLAADGETETIWHGLDLLPNPFTGLPPKVITATRWIGAPVWEIDGIGIYSFFVNSLGWHDAARMRDAWNRRAPLQPIPTPASEKTDD